MSKNNIMIQIKIKIGIKIKIKIKQILTKNTQLRTSTSQKDRKI